MSVSCPAREQEARGEQTVWDHVQVSSQSEDSSGYSSQSEDSSEYSSQSENSFEYSSQSENSFEYSSQSEVLTWRPIRG